MSVWWRWVLRERGLSTTPAAGSSPYPPPRTVGPALVPHTGDGPVMVQARKQTCPKSQGKRHL